MDFNRVVAFRKHPNHERGQVEVGCSHPSIGESTAPGNTLYDILRSLLDTLGLPANLYPDTAVSAEIRLALRGVRVDGLAHELARCLSHMGKSL
jgi:hypothetical protein